MSRDHELCLFFCIDGGTKERRRHTLSTLSSSLTLAKLMLLHCYSTEPLSYAGGVLGRRGGARASAGDLLYLEKHPSLLRTYLLNKKDGKMVKSGMAKMVAPEVAED